MTTAPDMVENVEFTCPRCGSHCFGSSAPLGSPPGRGPTEGQCHGYSSRGLPCRFTWKRPEQDAQVFRGTGSFHPRTVAGVQRA